MNWQLIRWSSISSLHVLCIAASLLFAGGCDSQEISLEPKNSLTSSNAQALETANPDKRATISPDSPRIVAFGNSLTAGLGVSPGQSYPSIFQKRLNSAGYNYKVINAGVSGDTTAGGLRRLGWVLKSHPSIVIVELGANDGLRGQSLDSIYSNLDKIISRLRNAEIKVVLAGMKIPPNYGLDYTTGFSSIFEQLAHKHQITLIPFLLEGVAARPELNQSDGIHPTATGYKIVADTVMAAIEPLLGKNDGL